MSNKRKRGPAKCKKKFLAPHQFKIEFDATGLAIGENQASFMSWVGLECRKKIPYHKVAKDVDGKLYDDVWEYTKESWNIPDDHAKEVTLKKAKVSMKNFRYHLRSEYIEKDLTPFELYKFLNKQQWDTFVAISSTEEFKEISQKASTNARKNINPARVGRCGFSGSDASYESKWSQLVSSYPHLVNLQNEYSRKYAVSRARRNPVTKLFELDENLQSEGVLTGPLAELYSKEKEMMADGSYYESGKDVVTEVIGKGRQHGGRTRLFSNVIGVTDSLFSGVKTKKKGHATELATATSPVTRGSSRASSSSYNHLPEIESVKKCELLWPYDRSVSNMVLATGLVYPTSQRYICKLLMKDGFVKVHVDRVEESCKVLPVLSETRIEGEVECMGDTEGCFIQWPRKSVKILNMDSPGQSVIAQHHSVSVPEYTSPQSVEQTHYRPEFEVSSDCQPQMAPSQDEIHELQRYTMALQDDRVFNDLLDVNVPYSNPAKSVHVFQPLKTVPASIPKVKDEKIARLLKGAESSRPQSIYRIAQQLVFKSNETKDIVVTSPPGMYVEPYTETIEIEAVVQLCVNGWADICFVHYFTMYLYSLGRNEGLNQTTYFNPRFVEAGMLATEKKNAINHIKSVISFQKDKQWFVAPHLVGGHWTLVLLQCHLKDKSWKGHIFDSLGKGKDPSDYMIRDIINEGIHKKITWNMVNCRQQANGWECGYCVMMNVYDFVINCREHLLINDCSLVRQEEIDELVERTLKLFAKGVVSSFVED